MLCSIRCFLFHAARFFARFSVFWICVAVVSAFFAVVCIDVSVYGFHRDVVPADAIIVLGAAAWGNKPSPVLRERINHAVSLYKKGLSKKIIFTGGKGFPTEPGESVIAKRYALKLAVPQNDIYIENISRTTEENLIYARRIGAENGCRTYILVSDPYHMKRAVAIAHYLGMNVYSSPTGTTAYKSFDKKMLFLMRESYFYLVYQLSHLVIPAGT